MSTDYATMNLKDLKALLKTMNVKGVSKLNKKQILTLLSQREQTETVPAAEPTPVVEEAPVAESKPTKKSTKKTSKSTKKTTKTTKKLTPAKAATEKKAEPVKMTDLPLEKKQLGELKELCKQNNVKGFSKMKKRDILALLKFFEEQKVEFVHPVHEVFSEQDDVAEPTDVLSKMSLKDLKKLAKSYKLKKYSKLNRTDVMALIQSRKLSSAEEKVQMKLKKMTMSALKKLCKELKLKGYSKLNKNAVMDLVMTKNVIPEPVVEEAPVATEEPAQQE